MIKVNYQNEDDELDEHEQKPTYGSRLINPDNNSSELVISINSQGVGIQPSYETRPVDRGGVQMQLQSPPKVYSGSTELNTKVQGASRYLNVQDNLIQQSLRDSEPVNKLRQSNKPRNQNEAYSFVQQTSGPNETFESPDVLKSINQMQYSQNRLLSSTGHEAEPSSKLKSQLARPISNLNMLDRQSSSSLFQPTAA